MKSVITLSGNEFQKNETSLIDMVEKYFNSIGGKVTNKLIGTISLDRRGIKADIAHGIGRKKAAAFKAIPTVIESGEIVDVQYNWKNRNYDTVVFAAPIIIGTDEYLMGVIVNKNDGPDRLYVHEVAAINEKEQLSLFKTGASAKSVYLSGNEDAPSLTRILHKILSVKNSILKEEGKDTIKFSIGGVNAEKQPTTGWFKGKDGKLRFEIDDSKAKVNYAAHRTRCIYLFRQNK